MILPFLLTTLNKINKLTNIYFHEYIATSLVSSSSPLSFTSFSSVSVLLVMCHLLLFIIVLKYCPLLPFTGESCYFKYFIYLFTASLLFAIGLSVIVRKCRSRCNVPANYCYSGKGTAWSF